MIAILDYQPDKLYNYLEDTPLNRSLRVLPERSNRYGKMHSEYGQHHGKDWGLEPDKKNKSG